VFETNRAYFKSEELKRILAGTSIDSELSDFRSNLEQLKKVTASSSELLAQRKKALKKGLLEKSQQDSMLEIASQAFTVAEDSNTFLDVVDVVTDSLSLASATSGSEGIGALALSRFQEVVTTFTANLDAIKSQTDLAMGLEIFSKAVSYPQEMVRDLASNKEAARSLGRIFGKANAVLRKTQGGQNLALNELDLTISKIQNSGNLIDTLVENAPDTETVSEILSGAIESSAESTYAAEELFSRISSLKSEIESDSEIRIDFSSIVQKGLGKARNVGSMVRLLSKNAVDSSDASEILALAARALNSRDLDSILMDETLSKDFGLRTRIFVSAGGPRVIEYEGSRAEVLLNASDSFDPQSSSLNFEWFEIVGNSESILAGLTSAIASHTVTGLSGTQTRRFKVIVTTSDSRHGSAFVDYVFRSELPPVVIAPEILQVRVGKSLRLSAEDSFDPNTGLREGLSFNWSFGGVPSVSINSPDQASSTFTFNEPGVFDGVIKVSMSGSNYATRSIRIVAKGVQPPTADAGSSVVLNRRKILESGGIKLDNFSYSPEDYENPNLTYSWEPISYFASDEGNNHTAREPRFIISEPGSYMVTLTVKEGLLASQDELEIQVTSGSRPVALAGPDRVIQLGDSNVDIELDGASSYSYSTSTPQFNWSGPLDFQNSSKTEPRAQLTLNPSDFPWKTVLTFTLEVADSAGSARDSINLVVLPKNRPPQIITELYPRKAVYAPGDIIELDASPSSSAGTSTLTFQWVNLSGIQLLSGESSLSTSRVVIQIPDVNQVTSFRMKLVASDSAGLSNKRKLVIPVVPAQLPPVALINLQKLFLRDSIDKQSIAINSHLSYGRAGGPLTYQWIVDSSKVSVLDSSLSSPVLNVQAADQAVDAKTRISLTVTDQNGLVDTDSIPVQIRAREQSTRPINLFAFFKQERSNTSFRENPFYDTSSGVSVFESTGSFQLFGVAANPNSSSEQVELTAGIFHLNNGVLETLVESLSLQGSTALTTRNEFSINGTLPQPGQYSLQISAHSSAAPALNKWIAIPFEVLDSQNTNFGSTLQIASIESISRGLQVVNQDSFQGQFVDEFLTVRLNTELTGLSGDHPVEYVFTHNWLSGSGPNLIFRELANGESEIVVPVTSSASALSFNVVVTDQIRNISSSPASVTLTLTKSNQLAPLANPGAYPKFTLSDGQLSKEITLDASGSLSPSGNSLSFIWTYLYSTNEFGVFGSTSVFGVSATSGTSRIVQADLIEGIHNFTLTAVDNSTALSDSAAFAIMVENAQTGSSGGSGSNGLADEDGDGIAVSIDVDDTNPALGLSQANQFKLLTMASFGPTVALLAEVETSEGAAAWIEGQLSAESAYTSNDDDWLSHLERTIAIAGKLEKGDMAPEGIFNEVDADVDIHRYQMSAWWDNALGNNPDQPRSGSDQLRQRMAYALSQLIVVSPVENLLERRGEAIAHFYDLLAKNAFGNYQDLLREISRSPAMGVYLTHVANQKASKLKSTRPDENFARELLQLFTLGLYALDSEGRPIPQGTGFKPVYTQDDIEELAKVMTGWNITQAEKGTTVQNIFKRVSDRRGDFTKLMTFHSQYHEDELDPLYDSDGDDVSDEDGRITLLGQQVDLSAPDDILDGSGTTTNSGLDEAMSVIFYHTNVPFHVSKHLIQHFVTSNPSQAYVKRVASVFANDDNGARGNLGAVIKSILLDPEAYSQGTETGGKIKEPMLAFTQMLRALNVRPWGVNDPGSGWKSKDGEMIADVYWYIVPEALIGYAPMRSPSVFNFFSPNYIAANELLASNKLVTPELEIQTDQYFVTYMRLLLHMAFGREKVAIEVEEQNSAANITSYNFNSTLSYWATGNMMIDFTEPLKRMEEAMENDSNLDFSSMNLEDVDSNGKTARMRGAEALISWYESRLIGKSMPVHMKLALMEYMLKGRTYHSEVDSLGSTDDWKRIYTAIKLIQESIAFVIMSPDFMIQN
jgi:uncharacterized protein (DUF1800 family)/PKD repeat protein